MARCTMSDVYCCILMYIYVLCLKYCSITLPCCPVFYRILPHGTSPFHILLYCTAPHRTAPHRSAPRRTAPHCTAPHRTAPHRTAPHIICLDPRRLGRVGARRLAAARVAEHAEVVDMPFRQGGSTSSARATECTATRRGMTWHKSRMSCISRAHTSGGL